MISSFNLFMIRPNINFSTLHYLKTPKLIFFFHKTSLSKHHTNTPPPKEPFLYTGFYADCFLFDSFGGTPFKRSIESPSAWKSPWFINSFIPGPRVDTDITIEV